MIRFARTFRQQPLPAITLVLMLAALACNAPGGSTSPTAAPADSGAPAATVDTSAQQPEQPATQEPPAGGQPTEESGGAAGPTPVPAPPSAPAPNVEFSGISFYRDNKVAGGWTSEIVQADEYTQEDVNDGAPINWFLPSHYLFSFTDYVIQVGAYQSPRMYVFPVANFEGYNEEGPQRIDNLTKLLQDKPQTFPNDIPVLPVFNAAQVFRARTQYIAFQNGEGIRFITYYTQAVNPITSRDIFYTFQGLTYDGKYYVSLIMPVSQLGLPANGEDVVGGDYDAFAAGYEAYLSTTLQALNEADSSTFTPTLDQLDTLVNSLTVSAGG